MSVVKFLRGLLDECIPVMDLIEIVIDYCNVRPISLPQSFHKLDPLNLPERTQPKIRLHPNVFVPLIVVGQLGFAKTTDTRGRIDLQFNFVVLNVLVVNNCCELEVAFVNYNDETGTVSDASIIHALVPPKVKITIPEELAIQYPCTCKSSSKEYVVHVSNCDYYVACSKHVQKVTDALPPAPKPVFTTVSDVAFQRFHIRFGCHEGSAAVYEWAHRVIVVPSCQVLPNRRLTLYFDVQSKSKPNRLATLPRCLAVKQPNLALQRLFHIPTTKMKWTI